MAMKPIHGYPLRCFVLKAIQDICEVEDKKTFTNKELYPEIAPKWPNVQMGQIQTAVSKEMVHGGYIKFLHRKSTGESKRGASAIFEITLKGAQADWKTIPGYERIIKSPEYEKPSRPSKTKSLNRVSLITKKAEKPKLPPSDAIIPSDILGESVIMLVEKLKSKTRGMAEMVSNLQSELRKEKEAFKLIKREKEKKEDELKKVIGNLQNRIKGLDRSRSGLSMREIASFK